MEDVNYNYPPDTIVFWSLSTNDDGAAEIRWLRQGDVGVDVANVPAGHDVKWTVEQLDRHVVIAWSTGLAVFAHTVGPFDPPVEARMFASQVKLMLGRPHEWVTETWDPNRGLRLAPDRPANVIEQADTNRATNDALAGKYRQLLDGNDVEGKLLLDVDATRRLQRMENAIKSVFSVLDDMLTTGDVDHLGYEPNTD